MSSPWPDLVVACFFAGLFLQSSWSIVTDACGELSAVGEVAWRSMTRLVQALIAVQRFGALAATLC